MTGGGTVTIRTAAPADAPSLARLSSELGYPVPPDQMRLRLDHACSNPQHAVLVAESGVIVGWIQVVRTMTLESGLLCEITGLVVTGTHRGAGIGRGLVAAAETWAMGRRCDRIRVRTNVIRDNARAFYSKLGFSVSKRQDVFDKPLPAAE
jgi:GNAT superfamily N-acetyltransferase